MTIYTDVFTGNSISSPIAYQKITFSSSLSKIQLLWPAESISTANSYNATNYYVGNIIDLSSSNVATRDIYLPDVTQQIAGTIFCLVDRTASGNIINFHDYNGNTIYIFNNFGPSTRIDFYITDNTLQSSWNHMLTAWSS